MEKKLKPFLSRKVKDQEAYEAYLVETSKVHFPLILHFGKWKTEQKAGM